MNKPLRILTILHMPWDRNLGGSRVQLELADEFQKMGHEVEKFDYCDAFRQAASSPLQRLTRASFSAKAKAFVRANAHRFDIIDAHQGNLPFSKQELGIKGLLLARSVGLYAFYEEFAKLEKTKWPPKRKKTAIANWLRSWLSRPDTPDCFRSLQTSDLINVPNHDEQAYVRDVLGMGDKCFVFPFGLSQQRQQALVQAVQPATVRLANKQVVFIGTWGSRKGARDWAEIVMRTKAKVPEVRFLFLGTAFSPEAVLADLNLPAYDWIEIVPRFEGEELPKLLSKATVGAFPSYIEGFGFAVLEKLACGLPTVAYNVPGPREMLRHFDNDFMIVPGDVEQFSNQIVKLLTMDEVSYSEISKRCIEVAQFFSWSRIAKETLDVYAKFLDVQK
ncbi:glycosyltransferase family 4 protein [Argonema galeatum]|uniref:glycosyltransferase family 4 protein n=1 Tax=Argonema galeatum TaxID=2942762 RepID=UPI002012224A|nr:glycosyltransferase family 4 protein [Argonema galeatum]MCL1463531.1 glycosyltransferase family 4 protein [Argonema galeatum A003/A1]